MILTDPIKSQITISLDTLVLSNISYKSKNGYSVSDFNKNPHAIFCVTIVNNSDKDFQINHSYNAFYYSYIFHDIIYFSKLFLWTNTNDPIFVTAHDSLHLKFQEFRFAYLGSYNKQKSNYYKEFASIIPTIKTFFILPDYKIVESNPPSFIKIPKKYYLENRNIVYGDKNFNFKLWLNYQNLKHKNQTMKIYFY